MKTYKQLKDFAEKNNVRFEVNPMWSKEYYNAGEGRYTRDIIGYYFGLNNITGRKGKSEYQWVWYETFDTTLSDEVSFFFAERFSCVSGKAYKGWEERNRANNIIG